LRVDRQSCGGLRVAQQALNGLVVQTL
jgi:hypothetical protein